MTTEGKLVFQTQQGVCTHALTVVVIVHAKPGPAQARQRSHHGEGDPSVEESY